MVIQNLYGNPKTKSVRLNSETRAKGPKGGHPTCVPMQPPMTHRSPLEMARVKGDPPKTGGSCLSNSPNGLSQNVKSKRRSPNKQGGHASQIAQTASQEMARARGDPPKTGGHASQIAQTAL